MAKNLTNAFIKSLKYKGYVTEKRDALNKLASEIERIVK
jgi:hypothetical protein